MATANISFSIEFECPELRQECPIPPNGTDMTDGLKDPLELSNSTETYHNQQQRIADQVEVKCILCSNEASSFCKECDLKLCPGCKEQHTIDPKTHGHDLFGLCSTHGNGLLFFCHPCRQAVCGGCSASEHNRSGHDVTPIHQVIGNLISRIQASSDKLEVARTQIEEKEAELLGLRETFQQKWISAEVQATSSAQRMITDKRNEIRSLNVNHQKLQEQINLLVSRRRTVEYRTKQLTEDVDKLENEKPKIIADVSEKFTKSAEFINQRLRSLLLRRNQLMVKIQQARAIASAKITIDAGNIANMTGICQELVDSVKASMECETVTMIAEVKISLRELGQQLRKVCNVSFSHNRPCKIVRMRQLPKNRLAALDRPGSDLRSDMILFHDEVSSAMTGTLEEGVQHSCDMAVSTTGDLIVARQKKPPIRVFKPDTGAFRDININHRGNVIDKLWYVETDGSDNMFVSTGQINPLILVVNPKGKVIHSLQLSGVAHHMAFCPQSRILYIAARNIMRRFYWSSIALKEMSSSSHGVAGFCCYDVCVNSGGGGGKVLVAGTMENEDIVIYQVRGEYDDDLVWTKIEYQDSEQRLSGDYPHICIKGDSLWLGYVNYIDKFQLL